MKQLVKIAAYAVLALVLARATNAWAAENAPGTPADYVLGAGDEITVWALEADEISGEPLRISPGGDIRLPLCGRVRAAGLAVGQLEAELERRLALYIQDPEVVVTMHSFGSRPVSVLGAVNRPGVHQLEGRKTLLEMLSLAGGLSGAAGAKIKITRGGEWGPIPLAGARSDAAGRFSVAEVRLDDVIEAHRPEDNILIMPHDVITVPRAEMVYVVGAVARAGAFALAERESISVLEALALAGGLKSTAAKKNARLLRPIEGVAERVEIPVNLKAIMAGKAPDMALSGDDILFIPASGSKTAVRRAAETAVSVASGAAVWRIGR